MRVLVTGASGLLGSYLLPRLLEAGHQPLAWSGSRSGERYGVNLQSVDLGSADETREQLDRADAEAVIHLAAISRGDAVLKDPQNARRINVEATATLADWCRGRGRQFLFTSTDMVFQGDRSWYREADETLPTQSYGRTKLEAEWAARACPGALVARLSLLYGLAPPGMDTFLSRELALLKNGQPRAYFQDEYRTPLPCSAGADALIGLLERKVAGIVHVGGRERLSRFELMKRLGSRLGIDPELIQPGFLDQHHFSEPRPADLSLSTNLLETILPTLDRPDVERAILGQ